MVDNNFTIKMKRWLEAGNHTEREDIMDGAMMLLKLNRNQMLFNTISRRPEKYVAKIEYELKKFLPIRLAQLTMADVKILDDQVTPFTKEAIEAEPAENETKDDETIDLPARSGKREDHDTLPDDIKGIWPKNAERWKKIKATYNTLLTLTEPCDRYEYLTILKELWYDYKADFERYDSYVVPVEDPEASEENAGSTDPLQLSKEISNARAYLSKNLEKYVKLKEEVLKEDAPAAAVSKSQDLRLKIQERLDVLVANKAVIGDDLKQSLEAIGIDTPATE